MNGVGRVCIVDLADVVWALMLLRIPMGVNTPVRVAFLGGSDCCVVGEGLWLRSRSVGSSTFGREPKYGFFRFLVSRPESPDLD